MSAPGEGIMTTYPFGTYAAGWGTSFSTPMVSGTAAVMISSYSGQSKSSGLLGSLLNVVSTSSFEPQVANALAHTQPVADPDMGHGRLDTYQATQAWRATFGLK